MTFEEIAKKAMDLTEAEATASAGKVIKEYEKVLKEMNASLKDVYAKLTGAKPEEYFNYMTKYNRLSMLIEDLQKKYLSAAKLVGKETMQAAESAIANSYYRNLYAVSWAEPANGIFTALPQSLIDVSVYGTQEAWKSISESTLQAYEERWGTVEGYVPQSGTLLEELLVKRSPALLADIESTIRMGLMAGDSYTKVAARIKKLMENDAWKALRIANTETHRNMMAGQYATSQMLKDEGVPVKRQIISVLDMRTREQSASVDGQFEDENGYFDYPGGVKVAIPGNSGNPAWDIQDRESVVMSVDGTSPQLRRGRNPVTGQTDLIEWTGFNDWMKDNNLVYKNGKMVIGG